MPTPKPRRNWMIVVGVLGVFALLILSLGYALWDTGSFYETDQLKQFVQEQQLHESSQ